MIQFFTPEDFYENPPLGITDSIAEYCSNKANDKLEREGKVVYGWEHSTYWRPCKTDCDAPSKQALLINIESIEKCTHPEEKVSFFYVLNVPQHYKCECGARLKPKTYEEIIE